MQPASTTIVEVSPRDGLQNEAKILPTGQKLELIRRSIAAGIRRIEATSFVNPNRVPQMADAEAVMAAVPRRPDVQYIGLALNVRGAERAVAAGVDEVNYVVITTDQYNMANQGCLTADTLAGWPKVAAMARAAGKSVTFTMAATFGCPFEGEVPVQRVVDLAREGAKENPSEIILADSIGVGAPTDVEAKVAAVRAALPGIPLRCHFHNTRNTGLANLVAGLRAGVSGFDASIGGIGGCPFAPGATGNIPTEDVIYMLNRMGVETGVNLEELIDAVQWLSGVLEKQMPGMLSRAGNFPRAAG